MPEIVTTRRENAILEITLLMRAQGVREKSADVAAEIIGSLQRKEPKTRAHDRFDSGRKPNVILHHGAPFLDDRRDQSRQKTAFPLDHQKGCKF